MDVCRAVNPNSYGVIGVLAVKNYFTGRLTLNFSRPGSMGVRRET